MMDEALLDRRQMLTGAAGAAFALAGGAAPLLAAQADPTSPVAAAARKAGMRFGSCFNAAARGDDRGSYLNPAYAALLERDCTILVPENEFKWQRIRPTADSYNFKPFDLMLDYAQRHGMAMRGHTLLWHKTKWYPRWLNDHDFGARPASEAERILTGHIRTLTSRYAGKIVSYDVVNEAVDAGSGKLEETSLSKAFGGGEGLLDLAFHTARDGAPGVQLVYNDYMSWEPHNETHRTGVLKLLEGFRKRGVPCDALGVQSHIDIKSIDPATGLGPHDEKGFRAFLDEVTGMGYGIVVTEFDVRDGGVSGDLAKRDRVVADYPRAYLDLMLSYKQLKDVLCWGLNDKYSWLQGFSPRDDKALLRCCPYDPDGKPKALYQTIADAFAARATRG